MGDPYKDDTGFQLLRLMVRPILGHKRSFRNDLGRIVQTITTTGLAADAEIRNAIRKGIPAEQWRLFLRAILNVLHPYDAIHVLTEARLIRPLEGIDEQLFIHTESRTSNMRIQAALKEPWTYNWIKTALRPGEVLYDIGANVGSYSLIALERGIRVVAFEAHYENFRELCRNVQLNNLGAKATLLPLALSDLWGATRNPILTASPGETMSLGVKTNGPVVILTGPLDEARPSLQLPDPNHIKIDVDGWEVRVLSGARQTFASENLRTCLIEIDRRAPGPDEERTSSVVNFLVERGFEIYSIVSRMTEGVTYLFGIRGDTIEIRSSLEQRGTYLKKCDLCVRGH